MEKIGTFFGIGLALWVAILAAGCDSGHDPGAGRAAAVTAAAASAAPAVAAAVTATAGEPVEIAVTSEGFVPSEIRTAVGQPLKLVVTRTLDRTCATEIVIRDYGINSPLPLNTPVTVELTPKAPGKIRFACAMDMIAGSITVN